MKKRERERQKKKNWEKKMGCWGQVGYFINEHNGRNGVKGKIIVVKIE